MTWRVTGAVLLFVVYVGTWFVAVAGASWLFAPLVLVPVFVVLIAGGNWLQQWLGITRPPPKFARPAREDPDEGAGKP